MPENDFLVRIPLVDPDQRSLGHRLAWQRDDRRPEKHSDEQRERLIGFVASQTSASSAGPIFLAAYPSTSQIEEVAKLSAQNTVLTFDVESLDKPGTLELTGLLSDYGFGMMLGDADLMLMESDDGLLDAFTHLQVHDSDPELKAIYCRAMYRDPAPKVLVDRIGNWQEFEAFAAMGLSGFFPGLCSAPREQSSRTTLNPQTLLILELMQMVQENVDITQIEQLLQRDAILSYKMLRYVNSASYGLNVEIRSLHHAVAMLGYARLLELLSILLAAVPKAAGTSPALLQAAVVRGRMTELLGQRILSRAQTGPLFLLGLFSLLDQLLGVPLEQILEHLTLAQPVAQALRAREGVLGSLLNLVEACERPQGRGAAIAKELSMEADHANRAHMSALAWAQDLPL